MALRNQVTRSAPCLVAFAPIVVTDRLRHACFSRQYRCAKPLDRLLSGTSRGRNPGAQPARPPVGEVQELFMNKRDLIDAISGRVGNKKDAAEAVNAILDTIQA